MLYYGFKKKLFLNDWESSTSMEKMLRAEVPGAQKDSDHDMPFGDLWFPSEEWGALQALWEEEWSAVIYILGWSFWLLC